MTDQSPLPRRKPTNLSLEADLVAEARRLGLSLSRAAEDGLRRAIAAEEGRRWLEENREALLSSNAYVEKHGLPLAKHPHVLMACFDLHRTDDGLVVDVQSDLIAILSTRVVVPLMPPDRAPKPARRLNPVFDVAGAPVVFVAQYIAAMPAGLLGPPAGSLAHARDEIRAALDMLFVGF